MSPDRRPGAVRAITFDFNGTLSDDEPILCEVVQAMFAARGKALSEQEYYDHLAGLSDEAIVTTWLGDDYPAVGELVAERIERYRAIVADGSTIGPAAREAVRYAASRVPIAVVSGAALAEIAPVLAAAGLEGAFQTIVSSDSVARGKPDPESYELACTRLAVSPAETVAFEDTEAGIASATGAGLRCLAMRGTLKPERLAAAEELIDTIDVGLIRRLLDG